MAIKNFRSRNQPFLALDSQLANTLIPLAIIIFTLMARIMPGPRTIDDAFITYRYARNIVAGEGFVYNPGERVQGTTTPFYALSLASLALIRGGTQANFPMIAMTLNAVADAVTVWLLWKLGIKLGYKFAGAVTALLWAIAPDSVTFAIGGLETSLYVMLLTATVSAHVHEKRKLTALLAALSLLTRPDALLLLGPLAIDRILLTVSRGRKVESTKISLAEMLAVGLPTIAWFSFATLYFGSPIPHSVMAKSLAYRLPDTAALIRLMQHYGTPFQEYLTFGVYWIAVGIILYPFFFVIGARGALRKSARLWPWVAYPWVYFLTFAIANPLIFRWYLTPPLPAYYFFILIGMEEFVKSIGQRAKSETGTVRWSAKIKPILLPVLFLFPVILTLRSWTQTPDHGPQRPAPQMAWFKLELLYRQAAERLNEEIIAQQPDNVPVLAAGDVGVLGFHTPTRILDTVGLNSPEALDYYPHDQGHYVINYAVPPDLIFDYGPDYIILLEVYGREGLFKDPRFDELYQLLEKIETDIYGSDGMLIFSRAP